MRASLKSEKSDVELELSHEEFESDMFAIISCSTPVTYHHVIEKIEAFIAEARQNGKMLALKLKFTDKKAF